MTGAIEEIGGGIDTIASFEKDRVFLFCHKKTKKLLKAVAVLLKDKNEDLAVKETIREALCLVDEVNVFFMEGDEICRKRALRSILSLFTFLETIAAIEVVSKNNASILISEYSKLADVLSGAKPHISVNAEADLETNNFSLDGLEVEVEKTRQESADIGQIKDSIKDLYLPQSKVLHKSQIGKIDNKSYQAVILNRQEKLKKQETKANFPYKTKSVGSAGKSGSDFSDRAKSIMAIIKENKSVTIKDISRIVKDVSEKTIQRELLSMVSSGALKKEGERRWSRYSLR